MLTVQKKSRQVAHSESCRVVVNGLGMYAVSAGEISRGGRIPLVLVHGLGVSGRYLLPALTELARSTRVYVPDLPGFGRSARPTRPLDVPELSDWLGAWMRAVGLSRAVLMGHSFGCQVVVDFALRHPELVERLVLAAPTVDPRARSALR